MNAEDRCCYEFGPFRLDTAEHTLFHKGRAVHLTPKAIETLLVLVENHGHLVEKDELLEKVWAGSFVEESNVAKHIYMLRKVLSGNGLAEPIIETIPTRGYRFVTPFKETEVEAAQEIAVEIKPTEEAEDSDISNLPSSSTTRKGITAPISMVGIIAVIAVLAVGGWYYLPSLIEGDGPTVEITQVSLSTGFEKVRSGIISPDGKLVAFSRVKPGEKRALAIRRLADGDTIDLVSDLQHPGGFAAFSPDSKFIYYLLHIHETNAHPLYRIPVTGGPGEEIAGDVWSSVTVSPNGNQLAFIRYNADQTKGTVIVADKNGKNQREILTANLSELFQVLWSIDGQRLLIGGLIMGSNGPAIQSAKWVNKDDKTETEAKELAPLFEQDWGDVRNLVLLKDGSGFLFGGKKNHSEPWQIFHLRAADGKITQINDLNNSGALMFSVSDDGKTLVVNKSAGPDAGFISNMISYDPVTKKSRQIMNDNRTIVLWLGFSQMPDGRILVANRTGKGSDFYLMNKEGGNETRLTSDASFKVNPMATADGKYIVFRSNRSGAHNLWRMNADGSNQIQLTNYLQKEMEGIPEIEKPNSSIQIANNAKTVFFAQQPNPGEKSKLMKIPINGGEALELLPNSSTSNYSPRISRDGKQIAYIGFVFDSKTSQLKSSTYIRTLNGDSVGELKKTIDEVDFEKRSYWTPDGKALSYYKYNPEIQLWDLWKLDIETGKKTALTSFESKADQVQMYKWSNDGKKIFIVRATQSQPDVVLIRTRDISKKLF